MFLHHLCRDPARPRVKCFPHSHFREDPCTSPGMELIKVLAVRSEDAPSRLTPEHLINGSFVIAYGSLFLALA